MNFASSTGADKQSLGLFLLLIDRQRILGSFLLGKLLARTTTRTHQLIPNIDAERKFLLVVRASFLDHPILRRHAIDTLRHLLEMGFGITPATTIEDRVELGQNMRIDKFIGCLIAFFEVYSSDESLKAIGEYLGPGSLTAPLFTTR